VRHTSKKSSSFVTCLGQSMSSSEHATAPSAVGEPQNVLGLLDVTTNINDPPPPYPSPERRSRILRMPRRHRPSVGPDALAEQPTSPSLHPHFFTASDGPSETTPLLQSSPRLHRANSHASTLVSSSSFTQTVLSFCRDSEDESDVNILEGPGGEQDAVAGDGQARNPARSRRSHYRRTWARYFRPMGRKAYHAAVFHLMVVNFPYALIAWIYLFVFTLTGTTLLITLPLGALLCFLDLLGARVFARGELALQTKFHGPLAYPPPYPPSPIFQRVRPAGASADESGESGVEYETSFYKNAYAMFADATTYQALFYFLVIKPCITLCMSIVLVVVVPVSYVLVLPAPLMLRFVRTVGIWQANVAVEGLYYQVA